MFYYSLDIFHDLLIVINYVINNTVDLVNIFIKMSNTISDTDQGTNNIIKNRVGLINGQPYIITGRKSFLPDVELIFIYNVIVGYIAHGL